MYPIQRQADVYGFFEPQDKPERTAAAPQSEVADLLRPPGIMAGLNVRHKEAGAYEDSLREQPHDGRFEHSQVQEWPPGSGQGWMPSAPGKGPTHLHPHYGPYTPNQQQYPGPHPISGDHPPIQNQMEGHPGYPMKIPPGIAPHMAVNTRGMNPEEHAYHGHPEGGYAQETGHFGPPEIAEHEEGRYERNAQGIEDDDESGYNWGPEPRPEDIAGPGMDPNFHDGRPLPFGTPTYNPGGGYEDYPGGGHDEFL